MFEQLRRDKVPIGQTECSRTTDFEKIMEPYPQAKPAQDINSIMLDFFFKYTQLYTHTCIKPFAYTSAINQSTDRKYERQATK